MPLWDQDRRDASRRFFGGFVAGSFATGILEGAPVFLLLCLGTCGDMWRYVASVRPADRARKH